MAARILQIAALAMCIYGFYGAELGTSSAAKPRVLSTPEECNRECNRHEAPRTCYYHFVVEYYSVLGPACKLCTPNATNHITGNCACVTADGVERGIITVNRMIPAPSIQVCENDRVVIDVENRVDGNEITIHWHGILQKGTQYYDGVPFVTQCPVQEGNTFRYQWVATAGTQFYHSHSGLQKVDGLHGSLIVRQDRSVDPSTHLYDYDLPSHVIVLSDWFHEPASERMPGRMLGPLSGQNPQSILINGMGRFTDPTTNVSTTTPLAVFTVTQGKRYRFRIVTAFSTACPAQLIIQGHNFTVIATDGDAVHPVQVNTLQSFSGERYDFVVYADQPPGSYWIQVRGLAGCAGIKTHQLAVLQYEKASNLTSTSAPTYDVGLTPVVVMSPLDANCSVPRADAVCVSQLQNAEHVDNVEMKELMGTPHIKIYTGINSNTLTDADFAPGKYIKFAEVGGGFASNKLINNITYKSPPSPLTSQYHDVPQSQFCNKDNLPANTTEPYYTCTHLIKVPLNSIVEWLIVDEVQIPGLYHPVHLHGHSYVVIGMGHASDYNITKISVHHVKDLDKKGKLHRKMYNLMYNPPKKDTLPTPNNGFSIVRFKANNPGFWFVHCHFLFHIATGMDLILQVGEPSDLPPVPAGFPKCGNHVPDIYV